MSPSHLQLSRRQLLQAAMLIGGTTAAGSLVGCSTIGGPQGSVSGPGTGKAGDPVTIGFVPIACASPLLAAQGMDLFKKHGVQVQLRKYSGWADLWTAYATGELDVAHMLSPMTIAANAGVTDATRATEIAFTQNTNGQALTLASRHHPKVQEPKDMNGFVLGIPFEYSVHALLLRDYLGAHGVDHRADLELRLLRPADMVAQLSVETIDGFIGPEPFLQRAVKTGSGKIFALTKTMWDGHPCCSVAMAKDFRAANPEAAANITAALAEGAKFVNNPAHVAKSAPLLAQEKFLNQKPELIAPALKGSYTSWDGKQLTDPDYLRFGDPTSATAVTWMSAQIARFDLGGNTLTWDDTSIRNAANDVLPRDADRSLKPVSINGRIFDPNRPTLQEAS